VGSLVKGTEHELASYDCRAVWLAVGSRHAQTCRVRMPFFALRWLRHRSALRCTARYDGSASAVPVTAGLCPWPLKLSIGKPRNRSKRWHGLNRKWPTSAWFRNCTRPWFLILSVTNDLINHDECYARFLVYIHRWQSLEKKILCLSLIRDNLEPSSDRCLF